MESNKKMGKFDVDIEIKDLLWEFVRRWRIIVILAVLCGAGLTLYQYRQDISKTDVVIVKKTQEELEKTMGEQDLDEVTAAAALKRQMDEKSAYMEASALMQINPYEEQAVILQYYVRAEEKTAADAAASYRAYIRNGSLAKTVSEKENAGIEPLYLSELICLNADESNVYIDSEEAKETIHLKAAGDTETASFSLKVIGRTSDEAEKIAQEVKAALKEYGNIISAAAGVHELELMEESCGMRVDQELAELQNRNATAIKTISNNLDKMKNEMTGDQISLYVYRTTAEEQAKQEENTGTAAEKAVQISVKHLIMGVIIGIILACGFIFISYLFAPALRSEEEIKTLYGIKILGMVDDSALQKKKLFGGIDRFILKLQNKRKKNLSLEQEMQMICTNVFLDCQKKGVQEVFLTSSTGECIPEDVWNKIKAGCEEKGIRVTSGNAIRYDAKALEQSAQIGNAVFIEKKRVSLYDELYSEIALCKEHDIYVMGMIVL